MADTWSTPGYELVGNFEWELLTLGQLPPPVPPVPPAPVAGQAIVSEYTARQSTWPGGGTVIDLEKAFLPWWLWPVLAGAGLALIFAKRR